MSRVNFFKQRGSGKRMFMKQSQLGVDVQAGEHIVLNIHYNSENYCVLLVGRTNKNFLRVLSWPQGLPTMYAGMTWGVSVNHVYSLGVASPEEIKRNEDKVDWEDGDLET